MYYSLKFEKNYKKNGINAISKSILKFTTLKNIRRCNS